MGCCFGKLIESFATGRGSELKFHGVVGRFPGLDGANQFRVTFRRYTGASGNRESNKKKENDWQLLFNS